SRMVAIARSRTSASSGRMSRIPRGGAGSSFGSRVTLSALLPGQCHDQLRLTRYFEEVPVTNDGRDQAGRASVLAGDGAHRPDDAVEAGVPLLEAEPGWAAEDHAEQSPGVDLILGNDELVDPVAVEVDGERHGLERIEIASAAALDLPNHLDLVAAATDDGA